MDYKQKGIKYKLKYIDLKNQTNKKYKLDNTTSEFIDSIKNGPPIYTLSVDKARKALDGATTAPIFNSQVTIKDIIIPENISIRIVRPTNTDNIKLPVVIYIHGGGWILGNKNTHDRLIKEIVTNANVIVIFVNYTPAPEAKYPTQINQIYDTLVYISQNADKLNIDVNNIIIMGDSAGSNMAIATALISKEKSGPKIKYVILAYPVTNSAMDTKSYQEFADGPWLTKKAMEWFYDNYLPENINRNDILISPSNATIMDLQNFPDTLLIVDENDVLRDEGEEFAHKLMDANVKVTAIRYLGTCHDFLILDALKNTQAVIGAMDMIVTQIKKIVKL